MSAMADDSQLSAGESTAGNAIENDSDWEYEYHETETETFYVTVDLSSSSSNIRIREKRGPPSSATADSPPTAEDNETASPIHGPALDSSDAVQILDFHTSNPLISYQGRLYSCEWSTTLGTDVLLISSKSSESPVLAATRNKLSGRPVRMIRHHGANKPSLQPSDKAAQTRKATVESNTPQVDSPIHPPEKNPAVQRPVLEIPLDRHASVARQNQAHFLERLSSIKAARGEPDEVTVYAKKRYTGTGWRARQRIQREMDSDDEGEGEDAVAIGDGDDDEDQDGDEGEDHDYQRMRATSPPSRAHQRKPRSRGRGRGRAGLFRDYRPITGKTNGGGLFRRQGASDEHPAPTGSDSRAAAPQTLDELIDPRMESRGDSPAANAIEPSSAATETGVGNPDVFMEDI